MRFKLLRLFAAVIHLCLILSLSSCIYPADELTPKIQIAVQDRYLKSLPSPFTPLAPSELSQPWANEVKIGKGFARQLDLYQTMTAFKRGSFLLPISEIQRSTELDYDICLAYYLGGKYREVLHTFDHSSLKNSTPLFKPYQDLLIMIYDSCRHLNLTERQDAVMNYIHTLYPQLADKLLLTTALQTADFALLLEKQDTYPAIKPVLDGYKAEAKSSSTAQILNALLPGSGYLYLGQKQSACTAFLLNGLFIWASAYSFQHHNIAAGIIFAGFEAGWYFGGIYGVKDEVKLYNERLYEAYAAPVMTQNQYFPLLMLSYGF